MVGKVGGSFNQIANTALSGTVGVKQCGSFDLKLVLKTVGGAIKDISTRGGEARLVELLNNYAAADGVKVSGQGGIVGTQTGGLTQQQQVHCFLASNLCSPVA